MKLIHTVWHMTFSQWCWWIFYSYGKWCHVDWYLQTSIVDTEAASYSETQASIYQSTWRHIPGNGNLQSTSHTNFIYIYIYTHTHTHKTHFRWLTITALCLAKQILKLHCRFLHHLQSSSVITKLSTQTLEYTEWIKHKFQCFCTTPTTCSLFLLLLFSLALKPSTGYVLLICEVFWSHTTSHSR
jgi:hypothetical protein